MLVSYCVPVRGHTIKLPSCGPQRLSTAERQGGPAAATRGIVLLMAASVSVTSHAMSLGTAAVILTASVPRQVRSAL